MTPERYAKLAAVLDRRQPDLTVVAENTRSTRNIAALLRTCDAVGIPEMHAVSVRSVRSHHLVAAGSEKWVSLRRHDRLESVCDQLGQRGFRILAAHQSRRAIDYRDADYTGPTAILLGGELWGVSATAAALADDHLVVPMKGLVASLNVSVAAALVLYEAMRQREAAGCYDSVRLDADTYARTLFEWAYPRVARRCRELGRPYPQLDENGALRHNPFEPAELIR